MKKKSVKSINHSKSVIQTNYDIIKAHGGELKVESKEARPPAWRTDRDDPVGRGKGLPADEAGTEFIITLPLKG